MSKLLSMQPIFDPKLYRDSPSAVEAGAVAATPPRFLPAEPLLEKANEWLEAHDALLVAAKRVAIAENLRAIYEQRPVPLIVQQLHIALRNCGVEVYEKPRYVEPKVYLGVDGLIDIVERAEGAAK